MLTALHEDHYITIPYAWNSNLSVARTNHGRKVVAQLRCNDVMIVARSTALAAFRFVGVISQSRSAIPDPLILTFSSIFDAMWIF